MRKLLKLSVLLFAATYTFAPPHLSASDKLVSGDLHSITIRKSDYERGEGRAYDILLNLTVSNNMHRSCCFMLSDCHVSYVIDYPNGESDFIAWGGVSVSSKTEKFNDKELPHVVLKPREVKEIHLRGEAADSEPKGVKGELMLSYQCSLSNTNTFYRGHFVYKNRLELENIPVQVLSSGKEGNSKAWTILPVREFPDSTTNDVFTNSPTPPPNDPSN